MFKRLNLTSYIFLGLILGSLLAITRMAIWRSSADFAEAMSLVTTIFLRLIKMIIAPLVFATLVVGIAKMGDAKEVGRVGGGHWLVHFASIISLTLGLIMVNFFRPR